MDRRTVAREVPSLSAYYDAAGLSSRIGSGRRPGDFVDGDGHLRLITEVIAETVKSLASAVSWRSFASSHRPSAALGGLHSTPRANPQWAAGGRASLEG
jgi:hypothetical protein